MTAKRHIEYTEEKKATEDMIGRFMFELAQTGASRAECDGPKDIQQAGSTKGEAPQKPVQIDKGLACGGIPSLLRYKHVHSYKAHSDEHC